MAISAKAKEILNRPDLIARRDQWFTRMQDLFDGRETDWNRKHVFGVMGIRPTGSHDPYEEPELWVEDCLEELAAKYEVLENESCFCPLCVEHFPFGVHYVDKILGARVWRQAGQWYNDYLTTPVGGLRMPDLDADPVWNSTRRAMEAFLEAEVALPLFGLPTYASTLNIAVNLYGQEILMEMLADPDNARKDLVTINDLICLLHEKSRALIPEQQLQPVISWCRTQPPGYGQLCGCTTQLISGELYAELVAPLDDKLLSVYPRGGMIHLCGSHGQHIESFRNMPSLKAVQVNDRAAEDLRLYFDGLREDQILYLDPCPGMTVERAMEITGGRRLVVMKKTDRPVLRK